MGFGVQGLGFRVYGLGFKVQGLGLGVQSLRLVVTRSNRLTAKLVLLLTDSLLELALVS